MIIFIIYSPYNKSRDMKLSTFENKISFENVLPRTNLITSSVPNLKEIFKSKELYIIFIHISIKNNSIYIILTCNIL